MPEKIVLYSSEWGQKNKLLKHKLFKRDKGTQLSCHVNLSSMCIHTRSDPEVIWIKHLSTRSLCKVQKVYLDSQLCKKSRFCVYVTVL